MKLKNISARLACTFMLLSLAFGTVYCMMYDGRCDYSTLPDAYYEIRFFARLGLYLSLVLLIVFFLLHSSASRKEKLAREEERKIREKTGPSKEDFNHSGFFFTTKSDEKLPYGEILSGNVYAAGKSVWCWAVFFLGGAYIYLCGAFAWLSELSILGLVILGVLVLTFLYGLFSPDYFLKPRAGSEASYVFDYDCLRLLRKKGDKAVAHRDLDWDDLLGVKEYESSFVLVFRTSFFAYGVMLPKKMMPIEARNFLARKSRE